MRTLPLSRLSWTRERLVVRCSQSQNTFPRMCCYRCHRVAEFDSPCNADSQFKFSKNPARLLKPIQYQVSLNKLPRKLTRRQRRYPGGKAGTAANTDASCPVAAERFAYPGMSRRRCRLRERFRHYRHSLLRCQLEEPAPGGTRAQQRLPGAMSAREKGLSKSFSVSTEREA